MLDRLLSATVAISLSLLVWLYARSRDQEPLDNVPIPVQVSLNPRQADQYTLEPMGSNQVLVSFTGPPQRIRELQAMLQRKELQVALTVTVPDDRLDESRYSDAIQIEPGHIQAPLGVTVLVHEGRNRIAYTLHRMVERELPVRFDHLGAPASVILDPATVVVRGPKEVLDKVTSIPTQPSELPDHQSGYRGEMPRVPLINELRGRPIRVMPSHVRVHVPRRSRKTYELTDIPVQFLCPAGFHLKPKFIDERGGKVNVKITGPVQDEPPRVFAFVDLSKGKFVSGLNHEPLQLQLPKDFQLTGNPPRVIAFELLPGDFTPKGLGMPEKSDP